MNKAYSVLINVLVSKGDKILLSQRSFDEKHMPGRWTIPGGKIENEDIKEEIIDVVEKTAKREVMEEVGVEIHDELKLVANNTFRRTDGQMVLALVFLGKYKTNEPKPLEDTIAVQWISKNEIDQYDFPPNVREYLEKGFSCIGNIDSSDNLSIGMNQ